MSIYVDGSSAIQLDDEPVKRFRTPEEEERERRKRARRLEEKRRAQAIVRMKRAALGVAAAAVAVALIVVMLNGMVRNNQLSSQISKLESQYSELNAQNNSKEYDIKRSVDLNTVIRVATEELGMERASAGQIINYKTADSETAGQLT